MTAPALLEAPPRPATAPLPAFLAPRTRDDRPRTGRGVAIGHHGEILQGMAYGADRRLHRALVSLPCPLFRSEASFVPDGSSRVRVEPAEAVKARAAAVLALEALDLASEGGGTLTVRCNMPPRWGLGSSTCDVVATVRAVARAHRRRLAPERIAALSVQAEVASDPAMFVETCTLFAQREGVVLEYFGRPLPPLEVLGFNADPLSGGVDTLSFRPAEYDWWEKEAFRPLIGMLRQAVRTGDAALVGRVATASARINQRFLPMPEFAWLEALAREAGALGVQVAHSGTVMGFLFDPADPRIDAHMDHAGRMLEDQNIHTTWRFRTSDLHE
jgi:uncharacterized protein involved in propanediol utilization